METLTFGKRHDIAVNDKVENAGSVSGDIIVEACQAGYVRIS